MKKKIISVLATLVAFALSSQATATWAGESLQEINNLQGATAYKYHKTSFFGRDYAGVTLVGKQEPQPPILRLQHGSTTESTTTTTFSRCKEKKGDRYTQAYFVGEEKKVIKQAGFQDAVNPANGQQPWTATVGGDGYSTGNLLLPAIAIGGGNAASGWGAGQARSIVSAVSSGGQGGTGGKTGPITNINDNTNINKNIPTAISSSSSSSAASAAAAAAAAASGGKGHH